MKFLFASLFHFIFLYKPSSYSFMQCIIFMYLRAFPDYYVCVYYRYIATIEACYNMVQKFYFFIALLQTHSLI